MPNTGVKLGDQGYTLNTKPSASLKSVAYSFRWLHLLCYLRKSTFGDRLVAILYLCRTLTDKKLPALPGALIFLPPKNQEDFSRL